MLFGPLPTAVFQYFFILCASLLLNQVLQVCRHKREKFQSLDNKLYFMLVLAMKVALCCIVQCSLDRLSPEILEVKLFLFAELYTLKAFSSAF